MKIINNKLTKDEMISFNQTIFSPQIEMFVPFAESNDPSRLNMSAKQQTQAVLSSNFFSKSLISIFPVFSS